MKREFADQYGALEGWHWWFRGRRRILEEVLQRELAPAGSRRIASLGCGPAVGLDWLEPLAGRGGRVIGVDIDPLHGARRGAGTDFVAGSVEALPLASRSFDLVLALDVLEHLDDDAGGLAETARLVSPGGILLVTVPAHPSLWGRQDEVSEHRRRYTRRTLTALYGRARLPQPRVTHFNTLLLPPVAAVRWARRALGGPATGESDFEDNRPGVVNEVLAAVFGSERHLIGRVPLPAGVSLLALLRV
jgi:SAM-dependent methyltransferase